MRYLQKTVNLGLQFSAGEGNSVVEAYSDADFANALSLKTVSSDMLMMYGTVCSGGPRDKTSSPEKKPKQS